MQDSPQPALPGMPPSQLAVCGVPGCGKPLRSDNTIGFCRSHLSVTSRSPLRICAVGGCGRGLRVTNKTGYCYEHTHEAPAVRQRSAERAVGYNAALRAQTAEARTTLPQCSAAGCTKRLQRRNRSGWCHQHSSRRHGRAECSFEDCATLLNSRNKTGRCQKHRLKLWVATVCGAEGCKVTLRAHNLTGLCKNHTNGYRRDSTLRRVYGITEAQYDAMLAAQGGVCALCGKPPKPGGVRSSSRLHVDHDHACCPGKKACGKCVRALLCSQCNRGIGCLKDDPALMRRAADYIERHAIPTLT